VNKLLIAAAAVLAFAPSAFADDNRIRAKLIGYEEVPAVSTAGSGVFKAKISQDEGLIEYELSYGGLEGTVQQSHIHFAQKAVNGSIVIWLCQTAGTPAPAAVAGLTPSCPQSGTVTGHITAANVVPAGTPSQRILAGELGEVVAAIRAGRAYVNVHTLPLNGGGEIRGQIGAGGREHDHDD
jgi:CHRD domain